MFGKNKIEGRSTTPQLKPENMTSEQREYYAALLIDTEIAQSEADEQAKKPVEVPINVLKSSKKPRDPSPY